MEENLFQFYLSNLEHSCGTRLDSVSAMNYDQSEVSAQSGGPIGFVPAGYASLLRQLANGIDIRLNTQVCRLAFVTEVSWKSFQCYSYGCSLHPYFIVFSFL
jgi:hypothetical protein